MVVGGDEDLPPFGTAYQLVPPVAMLSGHSLGTP
jgi:hypothetical protein